MNNTKLLQQAKSALNHNFNGVYTCPARGIYNHQWTWDSAFIAMAYAHIDFEKAENEFIQIFNGQWRDGMLPQIIFRKGEENGYYPDVKYWQKFNNKGRQTNYDTTAIAAPPIFGLALKHLYENASDKYRALNLVKKMYPKIHAYHEFLYRERDLQDEGICYIKHPWESGMAGSSVWDEILHQIVSETGEASSDELGVTDKLKRRPTHSLASQSTYILKKELFKVQDPLFNSILIASNEAMVELGDLIEFDNTDFLLWQELSSYGVNDKLWDNYKGAYQAWDILTDSPVICSTPAAFIPLIAGLPSYDQMLQIIKSYRSQAFAGSIQVPVYSCPTQDLSSEEVQYDHNWRGSVSLNMNWLLYEGFKRYGLIKLAAHIKKDSLELVNQFGFKQFFDPRKEAISNGYGANQYAWTAAVVIDFIMDKDIF